MVRFFHRGCRAVHDRLLHRARSVRRHRHARPGHTHRGIYVLGGDKAAQTLEELHHWLAVHNAAILSVLFVVIGAKLRGNGLEILV